MWVSGEYCGEERKCVRMRGPGPRELPRATPMVYIWSTCVRECVRTDMGHGEQTNDIAAPRSGNWP